jgi:hypothetical protein
VRIIEINSVAAASFNPTHIVASHLGSKPAGTSQQT